MLASPTHYKKCQDPFPLFSLYRHLTVHTSLNNAQGIEARISFFSDLFQKVAEIDYCILF